jgi:hypothetical protein
VQGKTNGQYDPALGVTRGQMAGFITRDLAVNVNENVIEPVATKPRPTAASNCAALVDGLAADQA